MKKIMMIAVLALIGFSASAKLKPIEKRPQDVTNYTYDVRSNRSFSTTLLGLEYSDEIKVAQRWTIIWRTGLVPTSFSLASQPGQTTFQGNMGLGLSLESRWYSNIAKRAAYGRCTYNNSSDFVSMRVRANSMIRLNGKLVNGWEVSFTPAYGIRRSFGRMWFHEFTIGPKIGMIRERTTYNTQVFLAPHAQYRIGIAF